MANERDKEKPAKARDQAKRQTTGGQQSHRSEYGTQGNQTSKSGGQPIGGNDSATGSGTPLTSAYGGAGGPGSTTGSGVGTPGGAAPPRSMGTRGDEFGQMSDYDRSGQQGQSGTGQADLGSQAGSTLAGHTDQQELGEIGGEVDQPASYGGGIDRRQSNTEGEGFILRQDSGSDDIQQRKGARKPSSAKSTGGSDFAAQGRGALDEEDEDESGTGPKDVGSGGPGSSV